jgi:hypothetical protein
MLNLIHWPIGMDLEDTFIFAWSAFWLHQGNVYYPSLLFY